MERSGDEERAPEPVGALLRRAARRALALVLFALALCAVTWLPVGRSSARGVAVDLRLVVPLLTTAGAVLALALLARPVRATPAWLAAQHVGLGLAASTSGLVVLAQEAQLRALAQGADLLSAWSAALAALERLAHPWSSADAVLVCGAPVGAALASLVFSGGRQGCGWALLVPAPGLALLGALGHLVGQGALLYGLFCTIGALPWLLLFQLAERPRTLLSGSG